MSLAPVATESATCANCSAPLVADQRYCLSCGQPCSPVRLAFLDVLQSESQPQLAQRSLGASTAVTYAPLLEPAAPAGWLRRYSPLFGALTVLLLAMIAGLLVGHWVTQSKAPVASEQTIKVEGLSAPAAAASATPTTAAATAAATPAASAASQPSAKQEAAEVAKEAKEEKTQAVKVEKAKPRKATVNTLQKLNSTTGKKHAEELNKLGAEPIETG